jgi:hypothetical protein
VLLWYEEDIFEQWLRDEVRQPLGPKLADLGATTPHHWMSRCMVQLSILEIRVLCRVRDTYLGWGVAGASNGFLTTACCARISTRSWPTSRRQTTCHSLRCPIPTKTPLRPSRQQGHSTGMRQSGFD